MAHTVFIDGEAGTTGLQIRERLERRDDIRLIRLPGDRRKDLAARVDACREAEVAILCLPDGAARELAAALEGADCRLIDASTAHRTAPGWAFGFPEMTKGQREAIAGASRVSNPGCWSSCAIALIRPLIEADVLAADAPVAITGVSGYSGGGKAMIAEFETGMTRGSFLYGAGQAHKHLSEITTHGLLSHPPGFVPSVGQFAQGMAVAVQVHLSHQGFDDAPRVLRAHYAGERFVRVVEPETHEPRTDPQRLNGTNFLDLSFHGNPESGNAVLIGVLDNLGKGASGAAVQNLNLMLGLDEGLGL